MRAEPQVKTQRQSQKLEKFKGGSLPPGLWLTQSQSLDIHTPGKGCPGQGALLWQLAKWPHAFATAAGEELPLWQGRRWEQGISAHFRVWMCFPPGREVRWQNSLAVDWMEGTKG